MEVDFGGDFLTIDSTKDGDIAEILDEGSKATLTFQGKSKDVINFKVRINGKELTYTPSNKQGKSLITAFGKETKKWISKKFQILHVEDKLIIRPIIL